MIISVVVGIVEEAMQLTERRRGTVHWERRIPGYEEDIITSSVHTMTILPIVARIPGYEQSLPIMSTLGAAI